MPIQNFLKATRFTYINTNILLPCCRIGLLYRGSEGGSKGGSKGVWRERGGREGVVMDGRRKLDRERDGGIEGGSWREEEAREGKRREGDRERGRDGRR